MLSFLFFSFLAAASVGSSNNDLANSTELSQVISDETSEKSEKLSACGEVYVDKQFFLKSPSYPENYPSNLTCHYLLKGPHCNTNYQFKFINFSLENSEGCKKDRFVIENQDVLCGKQNGTKTYFSKNGSLHVKFKTDEDISDMGYLIEVTRMPCEKGSDIIEVMTNTSLNATTKNAVPHIGSRMMMQTTEQEDNLKHCCKTTYKEKKFIITSPNFPLTLNQRTHCNFEIQKANNNICRLRFNFLFFWLGYTNSNSCPYGSLEIDGKQICGCNSDIVLTTTFGTSNTKILKFKTEGYYQEYASGFVLEVIQDECPKKYSPEKLNSNNSSNQYNFSNDQINKVLWFGDEQNIVEKLQLINEKTEILDDDEETYFGNKPKIIKSIYFYVAPDYDNIPSLNLNTERTMHIDVNNIDSVLVSTDNNQCYNWNQMQYKVLNRHYKNRLQCTRDETSANNIGNRHCEELNYVNGYFRSPGYPCFYPANLNICYRLRRKPGYCTVQVFIRDFQLEDSLHCVKDYFSLGSGMRHCGNSLHKASCKCEPA